MGEGVVGRPWGLAEPWLDSVHQHQGCGDQQDAEEKRHPGGDLLSLLLIAKREVIAGGSKRFGGVDLANPQHEEEEHQRADETYHAWNIDFHCVMLHRAIRAVVYHGLVVGRQVTGRRGSQAGSE